MAKVGELLVREGLITPAELEEALKMQVIFGGRLGTNLIEMGLLEEDEIARVLSRKLRVPFADPSLLNNIPAPVIAALPREIAERHKVVPLRLENRRLTLAMANPADLRAIDEIAFRTGFVIQPVVTPEVRLIQALENYYQINRDFRYIPFSRPAARRRSGAETVQGAPAATPPPSSESEPLIPLDELEFDEEGAGSTDHYLEAVVRHLAEAGSRDEIADLVIGWTGTRFSRAALLLVRDDGAQGWRASFDRRSVAGFDQLRIPLAEPSVFKTVAESRSWFLGPLPRTPFNSLFLQESGGGVPKTALLLPVLMMGRLIAILYVDGQDALQEKLLDLQKLAAKMVIAFEILVLKNKIVML